MLANCLGPLLKRCGPGFQVLSGFRDSAPVDQRSSILSRASTALSRTCSVADDFMGWQPRVASGRTGKLLPTVHLACPPSPSCSRCSIAAAPDVALSSIAYCIACPYCLSRKTLQEQCYVPMPTVASAAAVSPRLPDVQTKLSAYAGRATFPSGTHYA